MKKKQKKLMFKKMMVVFISDNDTAKLYVQFFRPK